MRPSLSRGCPHGSIARVATEGIGLFSALLFAGSLFILLLWGAVPAAIARDSWVGSEIRFHRDPGLDIEDGRFRCPSRDLAECLKEAFTVVEIYYEGDVEKPVVDAPDVEIKPLPRYRRNSPRRVSARIVSYSACSPTGNCPMLVLEERAPRQWEQILHFPGMAIDSSPSSWPGAQSALLAQTHISSVEGSFHLFVPFGRGYRCAGNEVHGESYGSEMAPCLLTPRGLDLVDEACPPLGQWLRGGAPEGTMGWGPETVQFRTDDVGMFLERAHTVLNGQCVPGFPGPEEPDRTFIVHIPEAPCLPLFWSRGFAWRWIGGEWYYPSLDGWGQEGWADANRETLDVLDLFKQCPPGCQSGIPWSVIENESDDIEDSEESWDSVPPPFAPEVSTSASCFQVLSTLGPGEVGVTWYGKAGDRWDICDFVALNSWDLQLAP